MNLSLNLIDICVLVIIVAFAVYGCSKGLIMTVFRLASFFASVALAKYLYPFVSRFIRETPVYGFFKDIVAKSLGLEEFFKSNTESLASLPIPDILRNMLESNNTPDVYSLLRVETLEDYVSGFFANIIINVLAMAVVFALAWMILSIIGSVLNIIGRLPVINALNRAGGLAAGLVMGAAISWVGLLIIAVLFASPAYPEVYAYTQGSIAAKWFFDSDMMMKLITGI